MFSNPTYSCQSFSLSIWCSIHSHASIPCFEGLDRIFNQSVIIWNKGGYLRQSIARICTTKCEIITGYRKYTENTCKNSPMVMWEPIHYNVKMEACPWPGVGDWVDWGPDRWRNKNVMLKSSNWMCFLRARIFGVMQQFYHTKCHIYISKTVNVRCN